MTKQLPHDHDASMEMSPVQSILIKLSAASFVCVSIAVMGLAVSPGRAATSDGIVSLAATTSGEQRDETAHLPQDRFADAPDGVDPIVTGPISASFRKQRIALDCDHAVWPQIPVGCYPK